MALTSQQTASGGGYYNPPGQQNFPSWQLPFQAPGRFQTFNPTTGVLKPQFQLDVTSARPDSPWLNMQLQREGMMYDNMREQALRDNMNSQTSAWNRLASTGGLSSGARERIGQTGQRSMAATNAQLANQSAQNQLGLRMQDFTNQVNADKWNIGNNFGQIDSQFGADWQVFDTQAQAYGAQQLADAYGNQARGPGNDPLSRMDPSNPNTMWSLPGTPVPLGKAKETVNRWGIPW